MRRQLTLVLFMLLAPVALISVGDHAPMADSVAAMPAPPTVTLRTSSGAVQSLNLEPIDEPYGPLTLTAAPATNTCSQAPVLRINDGGQTTNIRSFNSIVDPTDPILSCMWGNPPDFRGYRTAWYKFQPQAYGLVSLSTRSSNYDTVLAVYKGPCEALVPVACNDDYNYFTSRLALQVQAGETYYVEVADWHSAASGQLTLNLQSEPLPIDSQWQTVSAGSATDSFRSRHVVVADGTKLYVIAGQTSLGSDSDQTPTMYVYDTATGVTQYLDNMPGGEGVGYSDTTAALVNGQIYMPAGYTGGPIDGTHWVYDIAQNEWSDAVAADNDKWVGGPAIFSQATAYSFTGPPSQGYFLSGGMTGSFPVSDTSQDWSPSPELYFYSVDSKTWLKMPISMPTARFGHVAALQSINGQDHLCVAGGMGGTPGTNREALSSTECLNISQGTWSQFAPLNYARYFASSAVDATGNWYVFGGYDDSDNLIGVTERYDATQDQWTVLSSSYSVVPPRAWSRGAYIGNDLWIVGGEIVNESIVNIVQKTMLFRGSILTYMPLASGSEGTDRLYDTFATAKGLSYPAGTYDRFYGAYDTVNIYNFNVPSPRQTVQIKLSPQGSGNNLDLVLYTDNKAFKAASRQPGTITDKLTLDLNPGTYFIAVERVFPLVGSDPYPGQYLLQVSPG